jgi:hypothetical protein
MCDPLNACPHLLLPMRQWVPDSRQIEQILLELLHPSPLHVYQVLRVFTKSSVESVHHA